MTNQTAGVKKLTVADVRSTVQAAIITTGYGDGSNDRQELDFEWLTRALNDLFEEEQTAERDQLRHALQTLYDATPASCEDKALNEAQILAERALKEIE